MLQEIQSNYCQHFQNFKSTKKIVIEQKTFCKFCMSTNCSLWLCLHKNCGIIVCGKSIYLHLSSHLEQSKKTKSFHTIFININTAAIRCQHCNIQIADFEQLKQEERKKIALKGQFNNPLRFRYAILPFLQGLGQPKLMGQLEFSQGHKKISKGLVGIFADKYNYSVIPAIQFISHCNFFKDIILTTKTNQNCKAQILLKEFKSIVQKIEQANERAIRIEKFMDLITKIQPKLATYQRKDPFQTILQILNILHENISYYKLTNVLSNLGKDEWQLFYKPKQIQSHCPIYDSLASTLSLHYKCSQCQNEEDTLHQINFLKLQFPKRKRKNKVIEKQLNQKGYQSPKKRGKSLISFILAQEEIPITIPELLIQFLKQPFYKQKYCSKCRNQQLPMKLLKVDFKKIADILILQINRMPKNTDSIVQTEVLLNYDNINLSPFLENNNDWQTQSRFKQKVDENQRSMNYQFCTAIGIDKGLFNVVCKSRHNHQFYLIKNQSVQMLSKTKKVNPYIICLKRRTSPKTYEFFQEIKNQNSIIEAVSKESQRILSEDILSPEANIFLPDFYHIQLKNGVQLPVFNTMVCKHSKLKQSFLSKCEQQILITQTMYEHLVDTFKGILFINQVCDLCQEDIQTINQRRSRQKQLIKQYDMFKTHANVMISVSWLKKWSNYLYSQEKPFYFHKGYPLPPPIDNSMLLENGKCKPNLVKNRDFKIINIFIFKLLKQLYGGGPQIRYKWKNNDLSGLDQIKIKQIKNQASQLKEIYCDWEAESPKRSVILERTNSYMETVKQSQIEEELELPPHI